MAKSKKTSSAKTNAWFYHLCSINVRSGEQEYVIYELRSSRRPFSEEDYYREVLEFCGYDENETNEKLEVIAEDGRFEEWPYDDRMYLNPWVQDITKAEYKVLSKFLHCR